MATFSILYKDIDFQEIVYRFKFINYTKHHPVHYELGPATGGGHKEHGTVKAEDTAKSGLFYSLGTLEHGNVHVVKIPGVPDPGFRFWSGSDGQYINLNASDSKGYTVTKDSSEISEIIGNGYRITVDGGGIPNPSTESIHIQIYPHHESKPHHPHHDHWHELHGKHSYCYCACRSAGNNKEKHDFHHTMKVKKGAPYFYAVLTKDNNSIDFPHGAELTIEGPEGTKYDHHIKEENKLVIMSGSSVRYLIVKHPKPGDWKLKITADKGVKFHCECNTVPSRDVYRTIKNTLSKRDLTTDNGVADDSRGWIGAALLGLGIIALFSPPAILSGLIGAAVSGALSGAGVGLLLGKGDSPSKTAGFMSLAAEVKRHIKKFMKEVEEKGFHKTIKSYHNLFGKNLTYSEWKILLSRPHKTFQGLLSYALTFRVVEHMQDSDKQNAVRHALWQCVLVKRLGVDLATKLGDAHERERPGHKADNLADEINNIKGQRVADKVHSFVECESRVQEMLKDGKLQLREDLEKNVKLRSKENSIKIYKKPSLDANTEPYVGRDGDKVEITGYPKPDDKDWCKVEYKNRSKRGWVLEKFIEFEKVPDSLS
jgi:hypothetical protein